MPKKLTVSEVLDELDIMNDSDSGEEFVDDDDLDPDFDVYDEHISDNESVYRVTYRTYMVVIQVFRVSQKLSQGLMHPWILTIVMIVGVIVLYKPTVIQMGQL
jgi:hypothetical protein